MLEFRVEWLDAPGVRCSVLRRAWARLEITAGGQPLTRFFCSRSESVRPGVYTSVYPLARWMVRNWWSLLHEGLPTPGVLNGVRASHAWHRHRSWFERHNPLLSREGMAYPDVSFYREDELVGIRWVADPEKVTTPGRFIDQGYERLEVSVVEMAFRDFVEKVLERVDGLADDDLEDWKTNWSSIKSADSPEQELCQRLAALGLDPYDPDEGGTLETELARLAWPPGVIRDLLQATAPQQLSHDVNLVASLFKRLPSSQTDLPGKMSVTSASHHPLPYEAGYKRAAVVREFLGLSDRSKLADLDQALRDVLGPSKQSWDDERNGSDGARGSIDAVVQVNGGPALAATDRCDRGRRFLLARALHHWLFARSTEEPHRLLTRANDWQQAASRAFAAELLAPAAAIEEKLGGTGGWEEEEELAAHFNVSTMAIAHQLENHGLR